jgi:hypothetical protein
VKFNILENKNRTLSLGEKEEALKWLIDNFSITSFKVNGTSMAISKDTNL